MVHETNKKQYLVTGMTCAACQGHVERAVKKVPGVSKVSVALLTNSMIVEGTAGEDDVVRAVEKAGYGASPMGDTRAEGSPLISAEEEALKDRETPRLMKRLIWSVLFLVLLMYITMGHNMLSWPVPTFLDHNHLGLALSQMLLALFVLGINRDFFISGIRSLSQGAPNMDVLVAMGSGISFLWSLYIFYRMTWLITNGVSNMNIMPLYHDQLYFESAAMIPALITVGKLLEALSKGRTTDALKSLMRMAPKEALLLRNGEEIRLPVSEVRVGDIFLVKPGEAVPVDGEILSGTAALDEAALTGESVPVDKGIGDAVRAASINTNGYIQAKATRVGEDTSFAQIIRMVSEAAATKAPIARMADKVSAVFVPAVIGIAALVFAVHLAWGTSAQEALTYAITVLVISCPCALGLATPVAIMVGNGLGAKNGILFKTSEAMEMTGRIEIAALDKTGTLTEGAPRVTDIVPKDGASSGSVCAGTEIGASASTRHRRSCGRERDQSRRDHGSSHPSGKGSHRQAAGENALWRFPCLHHVSDRYCFSSRLCGRTLRRREDTASFYEGRYASRSHRCRRCSPEGFGQSRARTARDGHRGRHADGRQ